jgi:hypothetical protein
MAKVAKSFRLDSVAVEHLDELTGLTGSTQASIIEQSLAVYRSLLLGGLNGPRRILASTLPPLLAESPQESPQVTRSAAAPIKPKTYSVKSKGHTYEFSFPLQDIPAKGSMPCPCGSGQMFAKCHNADFKKAQKIGRTQRG